MNNFINNTQWCNIKWCDVKEFNLSMFCLLTYVNCLNFNFSDNSSIIFMSHTLYT